MKKHCSAFLYSVNTLLAYNINQYYYHGLHYVWCAARFDDDVNPPSSNPIEIYHSLNNDVIRGDRHSTKIEQNRIGLLKGVDAKCRASIIDEQTKDDLHHIIHNAEIAYFKPLLYVIDRRAIAENQIIKAPVKKTASLFSQEYIIEELTTEQFDVIKFRT